MSFSDEIKKVKSVEDCEEIACLDAYEECEVAAGWQACLEEALRGIAQCNLAGEIVDLEGFNMQGDTVVACINKNDHLINIAIDSIDFIGANKVQKLWIEAYLQCHY